MITQIKLTNFKCFKEETTFPLSNFNLLTGVNGGGKSTLLQSLLLMRQSIEHDMHTELILNGSCVNLGSFDDVRNREVSMSEPIIFEMSAVASDSFGGGYSHIYSMEGNFDFNSNNLLDMECSIRYFLEQSNDNMCLHFSEITFPIWNLKLMELQEQNEPSPSIDFKKNGYISIKATNYESVERLSGFEPSTYVYQNTLKHVAVHVRASIFGFANTHFISADRIGPQEFYRKSRLSSFPNVGTKGEFTVSLLDKLRDKLVHEQLCLGEDTKTLLTQTQAWLSKILNPVKVDVPSSKTNILELFLGSSKPANVGFGYSSILPIIVSGLIAEPEDKLIVENPEIHLHPKAQSALIQFLVSVAKTGVQVFVESHSDHVLNALRIAVLQNKLTSEEANILYFGENDQELVTQIPIQEDGTIETWPTGFFDQIDADLNVMLGI